MRFYFRKIVLFNFHLKIILNLLIFFLFRLSKNRIESLTDLETDLRKKLAFSILEDINLGKLTRFLHPEEDIREVCLFNLCHIFFSMVFCTVLLNFFDPLIFGTNTIVTVLQNSYYIVRFTD